MIGVTVKELSGGRTVKDVDGVVLESRGKGVSETGCVVVGAADGITSTFVGEGACTTCGVGSSVVALDSSEVKLKEEQVRCVFDTTFLTSSSFSWSSGFYHQQMLQKQQMLKLQQLRQIRPWAAAFSKLLCHKPANPGCDHSAQRLAG